MIQFFLKSLEVTIPVIRKVAIFLQGFRQQKCAGLACVAMFIVTGCQPKKLPILGEPDVTIKTINGQQVSEIAYPVIPEFSFKDQNNVTVSEKSFKNKIYVADFFFTTCPTICPVMKKNMLLVYEQFKNDPGVAILSHTIDPEHDTVDELKKYAVDLGVSNDMWRFVTGDREKIYEIGEKHYLVSAKADPNSPGGFIHGGSFVLVDKNRRIRGMYDGTSPESTKQLIRDIRNLQEE